MLTTFLKSLAGEQRVQRPPPKAQTDFFSMRPAGRSTICPAVRAPARAGVEILAADGTVAVTMTSGSFSPSLGVRIAMG